MEGASSPSSTSATTNTAPQSGSPESQSSEEGKTSLTGRKSPKKAAPTSQSSAPKDPTDGMTKEEKKAYKLVKADGQEYEVPEDYYHEAARKSITADKRIWEATQKEKALLEEKAKIEELREKYESFEKKTPAQMFAEVQQKLRDPDTTKEFRVAAEKWLTEQLIADDASPEQKRIAELEKKAAEYEARDKALEAKTKKEQQDKELSGYRQSAQESILNVLKVSNLPPTEYMVKAIADIKYNAAKAKVKLSDEQVANILKTDTIENSKALYGSVSDQIIKARESNDVDGVLRAGQALLDQLPEQVVKALRIFDLMNHTKARGLNVEKAPEPVTQSQDDSSNKGAYDMSWDQWKELEAKRLG